LDIGNYGDDDLPGTPLAHILPNEFQYSVRSFLEINCTYALPPIILSDLKLFTCLYLKINKMDYCETDGQFYSPRS